MNNHDFNIINQLVQEQKSLWRIEKHYIQEAQNEEEKAFWEHMRDEKRKHIEILTQMSQKCLG